MILLFFFAGLGEGALIVVLNIPIALMAAMMALRWAGAYGEHHERLGGLALGGRNFGGRGHGRSGETCTSIFPAAKSWHKPPPGMPRNENASCLVCLAMLCILAMFHANHVYGRPRARAMFLPLSLAVGFFPWWLLIFPFKHGGADSFGVDVARGMSRLQRIGKLKTTISLRFQAALRPNVAQDSRTGARLLYLPT